MGAKAEAERRRFVGDGGQVGGIEVLPFGFLVLVVGMLLVINAWTVVDAKSATVGAAQAATRTLVEGNGLDGEAERSARRAIESHGRDGSRVSIETLPGRGFGRCHRVGVRVNYEVPLIRVPLVGSFGNGVVVASSHYELVDPFRAGLAGAVDCAL